MRFLEEYEASFTQRESREFLLHTLVAIGCVPAYLSSVTALFGLLISPYLFFLIFKFRNCYFLPLVIHTMWGSQQRYMMAFGCFLCVLFNFQRLSQLKLQFLFGCYLAVLPFFVWYSWKRYLLFGGGIGHGGTFNGLGYYLAFAPFFWAVVKSLRITKENFKGLVFLSVAYLAVARFLPHTRFVAWAMNSMPIYFLWLVLGKKIHIRRGVIILTLVGTLAFGVAVVGIVGKVTFTQLGCVAVASLYVVAAKKAKSVVKWMSPIFFFIISALIVWYAIAHYYEFSNMYDKSVSYADLKMTDWSSLKEKFIRKAFDDRAPLWTAAWDGICQQVERDPVWVDPMPVYGEVDIGQRSVQIELMAHNISLLLLQEYGFYGGAGLYLLYIAIFSLRKLRLILADRFESLYTPLVACCFGHAVSGGLSGQYVMNIEFSFVLFAILGSCYFHWFDNRNKRLFGNGVIV